MKLSLLLLSAASRIAYVVGEIGDHPVETYDRDGKLRDLERVILERNLPVHVFSEEPPGVPTSCGTVPFIGPCCGDPLCWCDDPADGTCPPYPFDNIYVNRPERRDKT